MGKIVMVASLKGGVGKTTVSAALSYCLAKLGHKTVAVDMDFGVRSLDIALGHENSASPSCYDVITGKASVGLAIEGDERNENLFFISAPMNVDVTYDTEVTPKLFEKFIGDLKKEFDYVILDMAAGTGKLLDMARESELVDYVFVVSTQNAASIRAAEKLGSAFSTAVVEKTRLIINSFDPDRVGKGDYVSIMDVIDHSSVTLMGVVPYDKRVERLLSSGKTASEDKKSKAGIAIMNIARRLTGETVALLDRIIPKNKRLKYY